jgi:hypothetical protein
MLIVQMLDSIAIFIFFLYTWLKLSKFDLVQNLIQQHINKTEGL